MAAERFGEDRWQRILDLVRARGSVSVGELSALLDVSEVTIRRDVNTLAQQGQLTRVHGGVRARSAPARPPERSGGAPRRTLGIVVPSMDYYWPTIVNGAQACAATNASQLVLRTSSYTAEDDRHQVTRLLETTRVDGLLVAPLLAAGRADDVIGWLETLGVPVALMERSVPEGYFASHLEWVATDQFYAAGLGVRQFAAQGHRRVGLLTNLGTPHRDQAREGWASACRSLGLSTTGVVCEDTPRAIEEGCASALEGVIERCLSSGTTAVLVHSDREAMALVHRVVDLGLEIPGDLAVIAHDDEIAALSSPALSAVRPPKRQIGIAAADLLLRRLVDPARPLHHLLLCPEFISRDSSGPHRDRR